MAVLKKAKGALTAIGILSALGIIAVSARLIVRQQGGLPTGDTVWNLTCKVEFDAEKEGAFVHLAVPHDTKAIRVFGQDFTTHGMRQERLRGRGNGSREVTSVALRSGRVMMTADFDLHLSPSAGWKTPDTDRTLSPDERTRFLRSDKTIQSDGEEVSTALRPLRDRKPKTQAALVSLIFDYCTQQIVFDPEDTEDEDAATTLRQRSGGVLGRARAMVAMCRAARVPARLVAGFLLVEKDSEPTEPHVWVEVYLDGKWQPFDTEYGHTGTLPANYLPMRRGGSAVYSVVDGSDVDVSFTLVRRPVPRGLLGNERENFAEILDITRLPLATQSSLITLLLLPFGALLTTFFKNFIGVKTFGTFSPTLLALAAVYADWRTVVVIFALVIVFGVGGRALLPGFNLMQAPRLSIVFTLVAGSMVMSVSLLDYFGWNPTGHVVLLPMVVLTSLVDRIYSTADDDGMRVALVRLMWTTAVACLCFALFLWKGFGKIMLNFPELHLFTIAAMLLFGLYTGPKVSDVKYFAFLTEPPSAKKKKKSNGGKSGKSDETSSATPLTETTAAEQPGSKP